MEGNPSNHIGHTTDCEDLKVNLRDVCFHFHLWWRFLTPCCTFCKKPWGFSCVENLDRYHPFCMPQKMEEHRWVAGCVLHKTHKESLSKWSSHKEMCLKKNVRVPSSGNAQQQTLLKQLRLGSMRSLCRSGKYLEFWHSVWSQLTSEKLEVGQMHTEFLVAITKGLLREAKRYKLSSGGTG